jgi:hypothetical protein
MPKRLNPNLAKIHRSYLVGEAAELLGVHKNTVRGWVTEGLPVNDDLRPMLILGRELRGFLQERNHKKKQPCKKHEMYCLKCRLPKVPAGNMAEYKAMTSEKGCLIGICPTCENIINRFSNLAKLSAIEDILEVTIREQ